MLALEAGLQAVGVIKERLVCTIHASGSLMINIGYMGHDRGVVL